jgi:hypothetical protein
MLRKPRDTYISRRFCAYAPEISSFLILRLENSRFRGVTSQGIFERLISSFFLEFYLSQGPTSAISLGLRNRYSGTNKKMTVICVVYLLVP